MSHYIIAFTVAFLLSLFLTPLVRLFALKIGFIAYPRADRWHKHPTALLGGIGIYLAAVITILFVLPLDRNILGLLCGSTLLFLVGLADDRYKFTPYVKLFLQILACGIAVFFGITVTVPFYHLFSVPLTLLWIVGVTNSFNLLDNIDGLSAGIAAITSFMLFVTSLIFSNNPLGIVALILAGAALGFLPYNFNPAKIFMGDSGSMFLGYSLAVISVIGTSRHITNLFVTMFVPVLILCVPIFDTIFVVIGRKTQGKKIFEGGKDHTSHRLVTLGLTQRKAVLLLYLISLVFGFIGISYLRLDFYMVSIIAFLAIVILLYFGIFLFEGTSYGKDASLINRSEKNNSQAIMFTSVFMHKRRIIEVLLDFSFICIAYYGAYFLRFEKGLFLSNFALLKESILWIILIKMSIFFIFGLYRGTWKYIGISDFFTIFKVTTFGSFASVLFLTFAFRFREYSRAVFVIDWLLLFFLIMGSRFVFRILGEFFSRVRPPGKKILIFGAGDMGEMLAREIKRNKALGYTMVGFVDDDPKKIGMQIHGTRVLGSRANLKRIIKDKGVEELIIAISKINPDEIKDIVTVCEENEIAYRRIKGILD